MLKQIKEISGRLFRREPRVIALSTIVHGLSSVNEEIATTDPRELPRPTENELDVSQISTVDNNKEWPEVHCVPDCKCMNCRELLDNYAECVVCMEPLQGAGIFSCSTCGNMLCWRCSEKLRLCAFCRTDIGMNPCVRVRNLAMERLLARLSLPCRNARWGCTQKLQYKERIVHESQCSCGPTGCPLYKYCGWHGESKDIARHLKDTHDLTLVAANGINVEISDFRAKVNSTTERTRKYTVSLACHSHIYICKIVLHQYKLKIFFSHLPTEEAAPTDHKYGAWLEISGGGAFRTLKGVVPIFSKRKANKELVIPCAALVGPEKKRDDTVTISITIKPLTGQSACLFTAIKP